MQVFAVLPYDKTTAARPWIAERDLRASKMPLGQAGHANKAPASDTLHARLDWAVERRNYLAHGFWWDHTTKWSTRTGERTWGSFWTPPTGFENSAARSMRWYGYTCGVSASRPRCSCVRRRKLVVKPLDAPSIGECRRPMTDDIVHAWLVGKDGSEMTGLVLLDRDGLGWQLQRTVSGGASSRDRSRTGKSSRRCSATCPQRLLRDQGRSQVGLAS